MKCPKCDTDDIYYYRKIFQDATTTTEYTCNKCENKWKNVDKTNYIFVNGSVTNKIKGNRND